MVVGEFTIDVDVVVIGGGPGGYTAAIRASQLGMDVVLVEKEYLGGTCLNEGCIPSKSLLTSAKEFSSLKNMAQKGINSENISLNFEALQHWKQEQVVEKLRNGVASLCKGNNIQIVKGEATFINCREIRVQSEYQGQRYKFQHAIIATGSMPTRLKDIPFDENFILSSKEALELTTIPNRLVIVGGGYIGIELATVYSKFGSNVTVLEGEDDVLPQFGKNISRIIKQNLTKNGTKIITNARVEESMINADRTIKLIANVNGQSEDFEADKVLIAVGRMPNTASLGLEEAGVICNSKGFIITNEKCQTSVPHIYAIGDVAGEPMLAHKAMYEGKIAAEVISGQSSAKDSQCIPYVVFTDPEIATVGMTKHQAEEEGYTVITGKCPFQVNGRALSLNEKDGFVEVIADKDSGVVLGVQMVGPEVSNLISEATLAIELGTRLMDLALTIHPHPTLSEPFQEAAEHAMKFAIHLVNS